MHANSKQVRAAGLIVATIVAGACQAGPGATTAPATTTPTTPAAATTAPAATGTAATTAPVGTIGIPSGAIVQFTPTAGSTTQIQGGATLVGASGKTQVLIALLPA